MAEQVKAIRFQFDDKLDYQLDAIRSVVRLFDGLPQKVSGIYEPVTRLRRLTEGDPVRNPELSFGSRMLENLRAVQLDNGLYADSRLGGNHFTVEMETGTGKTYVYLRTVLELHREYGFKKFMIVVPSIPIRLGVETSIEQLRAHYKAIYDIDLGKHSFVYDSKTPGHVSSRFIETSDLSICILNIQAFNKDTNKIRAEDERGRVLWEDIKYIRPIVLLDEPQKIEGGKKRKSKSLQAIEGLRPLFVLRYSATHRRLYHQVYKLNSYDAYRRELVKRIEVKTVNGVIPKDFPYVRYLDFTEDLYARIELFSQAQGRGIRFETFKVRGNASLYTLSGGLPQYADCRVEEDPHKLRPLKIAARGGTTELSLGQSTYERTEREAVRIQIRLAIETHFKKQAAILRKGRSIKVLTLFFVDSVSKVRDRGRADGRGEYLRIFDEEYEKAAGGQKLRDMFEGLGGQYNLFAAPDRMTEVREGYFAVDNHRNAVEVEGWDASLAEEDMRLKAKSREDIDRGIGLILRNKDKLISFDEPLAFVFSHSALREGWDNPNVFTICALKNGGSEIAKKQEIGRGLRLPVDTSGVRCTDSAINELTVIANDSFARFADRLQNDFNDAMRFQKDEVTPEVLSATLKRAGVPPDKIGPKLIDTLRGELLRTGVISPQNLLTRDAHRLVSCAVFFDATLREHSAMILNALEVSMAERGTRKIHIRNGDQAPPENSTHSYVSEERFFRMFRSLSEQLSRRTIYKLNLDKDQFIAACIDEINALLRNRRMKHQYEVSGAGVRADDTGRIVVDSARTQVLNRYTEEGVARKSDFELANRIMYHTNLPRLAIFRILGGLEKKALLSNQDILELVISRIKYMLRAAKAEAVHAYEVIHGYEFDDKLIFEADSIDEAMLEAEKKVYRTREAEHRALHRYYRVDSKGEYDFAERLDSDPNVLLFTKIKKGGFVINTPCGNYTPDWAVVYKRGEGDIKFYFIIETKPGKEWSDLTDVERLKIKCGALHFRAVSGTTEDAVRFHWANSYEACKDKMDTE